MVRDGDAVDPFVSARLERKKEEAMEPENRELAVYGSERLPITQGAAECIIARLWPKAGPVAAGHAMLLAVQENLNPLNHELYIVPFKSKDGSISEAVVLGIEANRKMARRRTPYSYKDGPRPLTAQEMEDVGENPKEKVGVICVLETPAGAIFPGYGFWPKGTEPYGADKGNTKFNMASYRAERNALKRIMPDAELPAPVENVIDGVYADISEIIEAPKLRAPDSKRFDPPRPAMAPPQVPPEDLDQAFPSEPAGVPKAEKPILNEPDFLAMNHIEQAQMLTELQKKNRTLYAAVKERLGHRLKAVIDMTPNERLVLARAVLAEVV